MNVTKVLFFVLLGVLTFSSCGNDDDTDDIQPLSEGVNITLRNTLQDPNEDEQTYASLFMLADDAFDESDTLSNSTSEFATALAQPGTPFGDISGLYNIDFTENNISFTMLPSADDPFWQNVFGAFPAGKFDRYYFTFAESHNITGFSSANSSVNLRIDSDKVIVVEIGEGYDMNPGISFTVSLN